MPRALRSASRVSLVGVLTALVAITASGCGTTPRGGVDDALRAYDLHLYEDAYRTAALAVGRAGGHERDEAAYVAGLAAWRNGRPDQAERHLEIAARSTDDAIAGRAHAQLGVVHRDGGRPQQAAHHFAEASERLDGEQAQQAAECAAMCFRDLGDETSTGVWQRLAATEGGHFTPETFGQGLFALQVGAFRDRDHAEQAAAEVEPLAATQGLSPVRIVERADPRGRPLYLVHLGVFATRTAASEARTGLGSTRCIVAPCTVAP